MAQTILITGVSSGLGHGLAKLYLEKGAAVYGCSRRRPADLLDAGLHWAAIDLSAAEAAQPAFRKLIEPVDGFDCAILNAAKLGTIRDMADTPLPDLRETMEINVWANKWLLDTLFEGDRQVAQVVGISSGASQSGSRGWNGYSLSKAALNMLIKLYAGERPNTHFTALAPGLVDTEMQDYLTGLPEDDRYKPLEILKAAKGTDKMPDGETCARLLLDVFSQLQSYPSGEYVDVRKM
ncbi:MAG: SDR family NAD(P)-dependent oxidoreductase [Opitutales bacterium]